MEESITISKKTPESKSMRYDFLREEGLKHIQKLSGKIWTDYNAHDPGVTILEVLCYAITELGFRASYQIEDLITQDPNDPDIADIKNFFTARQILPNCPVTINDYRKLMIDVDVYDPHNQDCDHIGVRNAWIEKSKSSEIPVYVHKGDSKLSYEPDPNYVLQEGETELPPLEIGILYDVLLEFEKCEAYGDLNENSFTNELVITEHGPDQALKGLTIKIKVEFPRWDNEGVDWEDVLSIKESVINITIKFLNEPDGYKFDYELINNNVKLSGTKASSGGNVSIPGIDDIEVQINDFIYHGVSSLLDSYLQKIQKINQIIDKVKIRLHANRNLCEDFFRFNALKVEKIAVCSDIELEPEADVEKVQSLIYHEIGKFFSPVVNFYTLQEMLDKCKVRYDYTITEIDEENKSFTIDKDLTDLLSKGDTIIISGSTGNDGDYTVISIKPDSDNNKTEIFVSEDIPSELLTEGEMLSIYIVNEEDCLTVDEIFEGPPLEHGFINDNELEDADRKKYIRVSDLIQIIMKVPGVVAVRYIQIANLPQDNEDKSVESMSVKWCLKLAFDQNYVPRLSILDSKITFYKEQLPFKASQSKVDKLIDDLEALERFPKLFDPTLDLEIPRGQFKNPEDYASIQNDFPLTYGIGEEGLPVISRDKDLEKARKAQAKQLKGFLMFFDQRLANFFSQLAHVKDLFSMNAEKDAAGNYRIGRTYYTQPLFDIVPDVDEIYVDKDGHLAALNEIAEDEKLFGIRRNKFLDHLMARFSEQFTDYALLTYKLSGDKKAPEELIEDKLSFLNAYPEISSARGKAFNHQEPCKLWNIENISGLERRASLLVGIDERKISELHFSSNFSVVPSASEFAISVEDDSNNLLLKSNVNYSSEEEAKTALEEMIINGVCKEKFDIKTDDNTNYYFTLSCENQIIAVSERTDYPDNASGGEADLVIDELIKIFFDEFYNNLESNRKNLACPLDNYFEVTISTDLVTDPPTYTVSFNLYAEPFSFTAPNKIMEGSYTVEGEAKSMVDIVSVDLAVKKINIDGNIAEKLSPGDVLVVKDSDSNDGVYTVVTVTDVGGQTEIDVNEVIPSDLVPLGELYYNNETEDSLRVKAEANIYNILWEVIKNAIKGDQYYFYPDEDSYASPYVFKINNRFGEELAISIQSDFNDELATELNGLGSGAVAVSGSSGNDGDYAVVAADAKGPLVEIEVDTAPPYNVADGKLSFIESFSYAAQKDDNKLTVNADLTDKLNEGNIIVISGSVSNDGKYTIFSIGYNGSETELVVEETVPSDGNTGSLSYTKTFSIVEIDGNKFVIKGGYDDKAVQDMIAFITEKFFSREGFHVLENVQLRPKVKGPHFKEADGNTLNETLANNGSLVFKKTVNIFSASKSTNIFRVDADITAEVDRFSATEIASTITISGANVNDGEHSVEGVQYDSVPGRTHIEVEDVLADIPHSDPYGELSYLKITSIDSVVAADKKIIVAESDVLGLKEGDVVEIKNSTEDINDRKYKVDKLEDKGAQQEITINFVEKEFEDSLLEVVIDEEKKCDACQIVDPYTCVASIILPHWQGRFDNMDFRKSFDRQLRMEAPAHTFLNICWVSCEQMAEFEGKYKAWLVENAKKKKDYAKLSTSLNELIDILTKLRNVYPVGTLHDCKEDDTLENAIILDNSVLGDV